MPGERRGVPILFKRFSPVSIFPKMGVSRKN